MKLKVYLLAIILISFFSCNSDNDENEIEPQNKDYIEVAGIKWAKGNLLYDNGQWKIAEKQWKFFTSNKQAGLFNFGVITTTQISCYTGENDISGNPDYDIARCRLGKPWRIPSQQEMNFLTSRASRAYGYCIDDNGEQIYGWYFYDNDGQQEINFYPKEFTDEDLNRGLFLPFAKIRFGTAGIAVEEQGAYWTSTPLENSAYAIYLSLKKSGIILGVEPSRYNRWDGMSIRPIRD